MYGLILQNISDLHHIRQRAVGAGTDTNLIHLHSAQFRDFAHIVGRWESGHISAQDAARLSDMSIATFYRRLREFRGN